MDWYKRIFKNQRTRMKILKCLEFIPDTTMIKLQYWIKTGRKLNLSNPIRFSEKLQWYKLYYRNPLMIKCVDKFEVRNYLSELGYGELLIPQLGVWDNANDINWNELPDSFVLKTTNGSESNIFVSDKSIIDKHLIIKQLNYWLYQTNKNYGREWAYDGVKPRIVCEQIIEAENQFGFGLDDYKFFCFNGKAEFLYVLIDRFGNDGKPKLGVYDMDFNQLPVFRCDELRIERKLSMPSNFNEMVTIAEKLSKPFPQVRVDLYNVNGRVYFGEFTFYDGSGYMKYDPDEFDYDLGSKFVLPEKL